MSAGVFTRSKYEATYGTPPNQIHPIRVQPETIAAEIDSTPNDPPTGDITVPISAIISRGKRAKGLIPRIVTLQLPATGQPTGYKAGSIVRIPALTPAFYAAATPGAECTYLGVTCTVVSASNEIVR